MCMQSFSYTIRLAFSCRKVVVSIYYQSANCSKTDSIERWITLNDSKLLSFEYRKYKMKTFRFNFHLHNLNKYFVDYRSQTHPIVR